MLTHIEISFKYPQKMHKFGISHSHSFNTYILHKKCTADLILRTRFKRIIGMKERFSQNMEVPVWCAKAVFNTKFKNNTKLKKRILS